MFALLHTYLLENQSLLLAGTGKLNLIRQPALYDGGEQVLYPPYTYIGFAVSNEMPPESLIDFIASGLNIASEQATAIYQSFCDKICKEIATSGHLNWPHLGSFVKEAGNIIFKVDADIASINKPIAANSIIRQPKTHAMVVGNSETTSTIMEEYFAIQEEEKPVNRWWIAALMVGLTALTLIILKKMQIL
jgi:hypothetical protein